MTGKCRRKTQNGENHCSSDLGIHLRRKITRFPYPAATRAY
jgi:hypothetical protein